MVTRLLAYSFLSALLFTQVGEYWSSHWYTKWFVLIVLCSIALTYMTAKRTSWLFMPLMLYGLASGAVMFAFSFGPYHQPGLNPIVGLALEKNSAYTFISFVFSMLTLAFLPRKYAPSIKESLTAVVIIGSVWTLYEWYSHRIAYERGAFSGNASMHGLLLAALLPIGLDRMPKLWAKLSLVVLSGAAIYALKASVPIATAFISLGAYLLLLRGARSWPLILGLLAVAGVLGTQTYHPFFTASGRWENWRDLMHWWWANSSHLWGAGLGSSRTLTPIIQSIGWSREQHKEFFLWFHNDWLQSLFDLGIIGFIAVIVAWCRVAFQSVRTPALCASFLAFSSAAVVDYPLRLPIHLTCVVLIVWLIMNNQRSVDG